MAEFVFINQRKQPDFILNNNYLSKDNYFKMHVHRLLEFNVQKEGYGTYIIGNRRYSSQPKVIFIVGNSEPHQLIPDKVSTIYNLNIHFDPEIFCTPNEKSFNEIPLLSMFFHRAERFSHRLDRNNPATMKIYHLFELMENEAVQKSILYQQQIKTLLEQICIEILRNYDYCDLLNRQNCFQNPNFYLINKVLNFIDYNICHKLMLSQLAEVACMTPSYFSEFFKRYCGISPMHYIAQKRIDYACVLLRSSAQNIAEIAFTCGFNNLTSFNKAFQRVNGCSPTTYRKQLPSCHSIPAFEMASVISPITKSN